MITGKSLQTGYGTLPRERSRVLREAISRHMLPSAAAECEET